MPLRSFALVSVLLFGIGLIGFLRRRPGPTRGMSAILMLQGVVLLLVTSAVQGHQLDGQVAALLVLGLLPVQYILCLILRHNATSDITPEE